MANHHHNHHRLFHSPFLSLCSLLIIKMDNKLPIILIISITTTCFIFLLITFLILLCRPPPPPITHHPPPPPRSPSPVTLNLTFDPSIQEISMSDLSLATNNFSSDLIVGDGSFGFVYRAKLSNNVTVAVKKLDHDALQGIREFTAEMETLGRLRHPNIVRILGYCVSGPDRVLIYEFLEKGSLDFWLYENNDDTCALLWVTRVGIMYDVAKGLSYLHGLVKPVIHRDIKSSNVLLDKEFVAHIADFGLARRMEDESRSHVSTQVAGTMGYMPPEYWEGNTAATVKADVYSFGVLMLEMVTERRPNWTVVVDGKEVGLAQWAVMMERENRCFDMVCDGVGEEERESVEEYLRIACLCIRESTRERPTMNQVVELLEELCRGI